MEPPARVELPASFEDVPVDILAELIADMMQRLMAHNDQIPLSPESITRFHSRTAPTITILEYLRRIVRFTNVERSCLLITLNYIDHMCGRNPLFMFTSLTCHRFVIASIAVSSKALCDACCTNSLYARVGGIPIAEMNVLEREFLRMMDWRLTSSGEVLQEYYVNLVRTHSSGRFVRLDSSSGSVSSDSDMDFEMSPSRSVSPELPHPTARVPGIHIAAATRTLGSPLAPTIEQNMAFAELQQEQP